MRPSPGFRCFFVFGSTFVDAAARFTNVDGGVFALAMKFIDPFAFAWRGACLVFGTEDALEVATFFVV